MKAQLSLSVFSAICCSSSIAQQGCIRISFLSPHFHSSAVCHLGWMPAKGVSI